MPHEFIVHRGMIGEVPAVMNESISSFIRSGSLIGIKLRFFIRIEFY